MEVKLNKEQARQFAFDWYDIIVDRLAKETTDDNLIDLSASETKDNITMIA